MKGQSININWLIGTTIFLTALIFSITYTFNNYTSEQGGVGLQQQIENIRTNIDEEASVTIRRTPLIVKSPGLNAVLPVKERYIFSAFTEDVTFENPYDINTSSGMVRSTVDTTVDEVPLTQFYGSVENPSFSSDISATGQLSNTYLDINPGGDGLQQISYLSNNLLENGAEFASSDFSTTDYDIYGDTLGGDLEIYDESPEIVLETSTVENYYFENFTTLYWRNGTQTDTLVGNGGFQSGKTNGFVLHGLSGSNIGAAFVGKMDATVAKPDNETVNVTVDAENYRIYMFNDDLNEGRDRILFEENGGMFFGVAKEFEALSIETLNEIDEWDETTTRENLEIENIGYNLTIRENIGSLLESGTDTEEEWNQGSFLSTTAFGTGNLRLGYRNEENNGDVAGFWRFDETTDTVAGPGEVKDYTGNGNHGSFSPGSEGDERNATGVFDSYSFEFDGEDDYVAVADSSELTIERDIAISAWFKPAEDHFGGIIQKTDGTNGEYEINHLNNEEIEFVLNWQQSDEITCSTGTGVTNIGEWNHVIIVYDPVVAGNDISIWVNGELEETCSFAGTIEPAPGSAPLYIGANPGGGNEYFNGSIDEVKIFSDSINQDRIEGMIMTQDSGTYYGNYTSETTNFEEKVDWDQLIYDADIPSGNQLFLRFESVNPGGRTVKSKTVELSDGQNSVNLTDVQDMFQSRVVIFGNSNNATKTWKLNSFALNFDDDTLLVSAGSNVPFRDVTIERESSVGVSDEGEINRLEDRIAVWR